MKNTLHHESVADEEYRLGQAAEGRDTSDHSRILWRITMNRMKRRRLSRRYKTKKGRPLVKLTAVQCLVSLSEITGSAKTRVESNVMLEECAPCVNDADPSLAYHSDTLAHDWLQPDQASR